MNKETFFKILKKHFQKDDVNNFHGIIIKPLFDDELITFEFNNPNNLSYNITPIRGHFYDECDMFGKILGITELEMYTKYIKHTDYTHGNRLFINDSDRQMLTNITKKYNHRFIVNSSRYEDVSLYADINVVGDVNLSSYDSESINLEVDIKFENLTNPKKPNHNLNRNISIFRNWLYNDYNNYDDITSDMFQHTYDLITKNPLLFDDSFMYLNTHITPIVYDEEGNKADF